MPSDNIDYTLTGGRRHFGGKLNHGQMTDLSNQFNRSTHSINEDKYDAVINNNGDKIYLARREQDNTIYLYFYGVPKNIKIERMRYKMQTGKEPIKTYMCAWVKDNAATKLVREEKVDIYSPANKSTPFIAKDINDNYKVYANYKIHEQIVPVEIEFMERILKDKFELILSLPQDKQNDVLMWLLQSYNTTKVQVNRGDMLKSLLNKYGAQPISSLKTAKHG